MMLHMGYGSRADVEAIGFNFLNAPGGMELYSRTTIEKPSTSSIILRDYVLVLEEANPTIFFKEAPPDNQENNIAHDALVLRRSGGCNWVFKKKNDMDGNVNTFKAILAAKGYTHIQGVDHSETYLPEVSTPAIGCYLQMDVKTAFLNGRLYEDAYMEQPDGFQSPKFQKYPGEEHWTAGKNTLRNLRRTNDMFLDYGGYVFIMNDGAVAWRSSKQDTIAMSSTEAEYIVVLEVAQVAY
ncbi:retrovirus-related pol polyprotein from transposon TNT 1-94 [Tanacetum coccineum]